MAKLDILDPSHSYACIALYERMAFENNEANVQIQAIKERLLLVVWILFY